MERILLGGANASQQSSMLTYFETEQYINSLKLYPIEEVGTKKWMKQRQVIDELNYQSHLNVFQNADDFVTSLFISLSKIPILLHELIVIETWKSKVASLINSELVQASKHSVKPYLIYYHEAVLANILECMFFSKDAAIASEDCLIDLVDFCQRKINFLNTIKEKKHVELSKEAILKQTEEEHFEEQKKGIELNVAFAAVTIFRFITDAIGELSPSISTRIVNTNDAIISLVYLLENAPWKRKGKNGYYIFENGKWILQKEDELLQVCQQEAQIWLSLNNLLVDNETSSKYEYTEFRKECIFKLKRYLHENVIDQIPILTDLQQRIDQLQIVQPKTSQSGFFVVEQVAQIKDSLMKKRNWETIAQQQLTIILEEDEEEKRQQMENLNKMFAGVLENMDHYSEQREEWLGMSAAKK